MQFEKRKIILKYPNEFLQFKIHSLIPKFILSFEINFKRKCSFQSIYLLPFQLFVTNERWVAVTSSVVGYHQADHMQEK